MNKEIIKRRILIFGAGVIGSVFGGLIASSGQNVTLLARNKRLRELNNRGLLLKRRGEKKAQTIPVKIISELHQDDIYDFVFVTLRKEQVRDALPLLKKNRSQNFVFMVNNPSGYDEWTKTLGQDRVLPVFPGAGGKIEDGIVYYGIVSGIIQPTTIGEIDGTYSDRLRELKIVLKNAGFKVSISKNIDAWQKTHVAVVGPLGDVIYVDGGDNYSAARNSGAIKQMNLALKENLKFLKDSGIGIEPWKLNIIRFMPVWILNLIMKNLFDTKWAETMISNHALNARREMEVISNELIDLANTKGYDLKEFKKLVSEM